MRQSGPSKFDDTFGNSECVFYSLTPFSAVMTDYHRFDNFH